MNENLLRISFTFILLVIWLSYTQSVIVRENEKDSIINETAVSLLQEEPVYFVENTQEKPKQEEIQKQEEIKQQEEPKQEEIQKQEEPQENKQEEVKQEEQEQEEIQENKQEEVKQEEPKQEEPKQEEVKQEEQEPIKEENKQEEVKQEEPKQEEIQENKQEEVKQEEPKQEEIQQQEEPKQEEIQKQEEPQENKQEELKQEEQEPIKEELKQEPVKEEVKQEEPQEKEIEENKEKEQKQEENVKSEIYISQDILGEDIKAMAVQKNYIAVAGESGSVVLIDRKSKQKINWIEETQCESIEHLYFTQDEKYLFSVDSKGYIIKWNLANKRDEGWTKANSNIESMTFSNDGNLCSIQTEKYTRIYDFSSDKAKNISTLTKLGQSIVITSNSILSLCKETSKRMSSFCVYGMKNNKWDRKPLFETSDFIGNMISYDSDCIAWNQNQIFSLNATESLQNKSWQWNLWLTCSKNIDTIVYNEDGSIVGVIDADSMVAFYKRTTGKQLGTINIPSDMIKESLYITNAFQLILLSKNGNIYKIDIAF